MNQELQQMMTDLDAIAGEIDRELAAAESFTPSGRLELAMPHVNAAHDAVARFGRMLADTAKWDRGGQIGAIRRNGAKPQEPAPQEPAPPPSGLKPGQVVADVGTASGDYTGPLDPDTLTPGNWRYWGEHNELHARTGQIFSKAPTLRDPATGRLLTMGDYANATADGGPFLPFG